MTTGLEEFDESNLNQWMRRQMAQETWKEDAPAEVIDIWKKADSKRIALNERLHELAAFKLRAGELEPRQLSEETIGHVGMMGLATRGFVVAYCRATEAWLLHKTNEFAQEFTDALSSMQIELNKRQGARPLEELQAELHIMKADLQAKVDQLKDGLQTDSQDTDQNGA